MSDLRPNSEIADGIHWIKDSYVNSYLVETDHDELVTIDTGLNKKAKNLMKYIKSELSSEIPTAVMLTHHHLDHMGGLHTLDTHFHPRKFAHPKDAEVITGERKSPLPNNLLLKPIVWFFMKIASPKRVQGIEHIDDGQEELGFKIYHLPGHTEGSVGFLKNKSMFSGDAAVTGKNQINVGPKAVMEDEDGVYRSFKKLSKLNFEQILPGHGTPILEDASIRMRDAVERLGLE